MSERPTVYFTFGNHMHWVDMQWLWGAEVLPGSVSDMLALVRATGAKGNVNFEGVGYEKMAAESPEALASLRDAVGRGDIEPVGCSYGQPYGLFHGGESNVRQLVQGVRAVRRLLGVRPRAFWEEEFYFFPQLPQMLAGCGFDGACLFFQWTWHTPELPKETAALVWWEGADGTRVLSLPRGELNVHQWPEDFDGLVERAAAAGSGASGGSAAIVQWLELMPSKDWMCRSEVLLPKLRELMSDERVVVRPGTVTGVIDGLGRAGAWPVRRYGMDEVWHGMTLGKNADEHPRRSKLAEMRLIGAEAMAAVAGMLGRPYPRWDVYPWWELEEGWRELLMAQHHDNHECEGLCGDLGALGFQRAEELATGVATRTMQALADRSGSESEDGHVHAELVFNPCGHARDLVVREHGGRRAVVAKGVPAFGFAVVDPSKGEAAERAVVKGDRKTVELSLGGVRAVIDRASGHVTQVFSPHAAGGHLARPLGVISAGFDGERSEARTVKTEVAEGEDGTPIVRTIRECADGTMVVVDYSMLDRPGPGLHMSVEFEETPTVDGGYGGSVRTRVDVGVKEAVLFADTPYAIERVEGSVEGKRKYPEGDWMTSPQWFETVRGSIYGQSLLDVTDGGGAGLLVLHEGSGQFFRTGEASVEHVLNAYDPWDEAHAELRGTVHVRYVPHGLLTHAQRARMAIELAVPEFSMCCALSGRGGGRLPERFGIGFESAGGVLLHALYREAAKGGEHLPAWAGRRLSEMSGGACTHPYVARLVEWNGEPGEGVLRIPGRVAGAIRTNLMGEAVEGGVRVESGEKESVIRVSLRAREIATVMFDAEQGRKQWRDLDAKRKIWATVHRGGGRSGGR